MIRALLAILFPRRLPLRPAASWGWIDDAEMSRRLRAVDEREPFYGPEAWAAADRIAALSAENAKLREGR